MIMANWDDMTSPSPSLELDAFTTSSISSHGSINEIEDDVSTSSSSILGRSNYNQSNQSNQNENSEVEPFLLCGHINLHKSPACGAQFTSYINYAIKHFKMDKFGNIKSQYIPSNRGSRPRTVTEWRNRREAKAKATSDLNSDLNLNQQNQQNPPLLDSDSDSESDSGSSSDAEPDDGADQMDPTGAGDHAIWKKFQKDLNKFMKEVRKGTDATEVAAGDDHTDHQPQVQPKGREPDGFLFGVQEPAVAFGRLTNINGATIIFSQKAKKVRSALVMSSTIQAWPVSDLMDGDFAVCQLKLKNDQVIYVASIYADQAKTPICNKLKQLVGRARNENVQVLVMGDLNAHSEDLWNSKSTCPRGRKWEEFVLDKGLVVHNTGDVFTFNTKKGQTIIDATLSSAGISNQIKAWRVADRVPASDHLSIEFVLQIQCSDTETRNIFRRCDWPEYKKQLDTKKSP